MVRESASTGRCGRRDPRVLSYPDRPRPSRSWRIKEAQRLMVNRNLLHMYDLPADELEQLDAMVPDHWLPDEKEPIDVNKIVTGRVLEIRGDDVVIDIGYKSEGVIRLEEWKEEGLDPS